MKNLELWESFCSPPESALKRITGGRLKGKHDINPQWRYRALTEAFGPCGVGWRYEVRRRWTEAGPDGQVVAFVDIDFFYMTDDGQWSQPVPGTGGSMLVAKEKDGLTANDEAYKMATTDALSVATKMIGVAANVYLGMYDGKYVSQDDNFGPPPWTPPSTPPAASSAPPAPTPDPRGESFESPKYLTEREVEKINGVLTKNHMVIESTLDFLNELDGLHDRAMGLRGIKRKFAKRIIESPDNFVLSYKKYILKKDLMEREAIDNE